MGKEQTVAPCFRRFPACAVGRAGAIQRGEQVRKAARLSVQRWQGCGSFPIRRRCFSRRKTVVLAKARTIANSYNPQEYAFVCPEGKLLTYHRLNCNQSTGKHLLCYQASCTDCSHCGRRKTCFETNSTRRRVLASGCYPAFFRGHSCVGTPAYLSMMRLRRIWAEGSFILPEFVNRHWSCC